MQFRTPCQDHQAGESAVKLPYQGQNRMLEWVLNRDHVDYYPGVLTTQPRLHDCPLFTYNNAFALPIMMALEKGSRCKKNRGHFLRFKFFWSLVKLISKKRLSFLESHRYGHTMKK